MAGNDWSTTEVKGLRELHDAMQKLPANIGRNVLRGAVNAGATVIRQEAKLRAPRWDGPVSAGHPPAGTLLRSIFQVRRRDLSTTVMQVMHVGVRSGKRLTDKAGRSLDAYYWRFVEFGTAKMAARPFMRPAFEAKKLAAVEAIRTYLAKRIPAEADKLNRGRRS